jgi:hypothetical protein
MLPHGSCAETNEGRRLFFLVVDDVDLLARTGKFQPLADFDLLLLRVALEPQDSLLFLFDFPMQLLIAELILMHLAPLVEQTGNTVGAAQHHKCVEYPA